jgi:hypothetical protein
MGLSAITQGKTFTWAFDDVHQRIEFLYNILALCTAYKKSPKLVGFDLELVSAQFDASKKARKQMKEKHQSFMEDFDDFEKKDKRTADELPWIDLDIMLNDFNWQASGDASALEARLITELQALEKVYLF